MNITVYLGANEGREPALKTAVCELGTWIGEHGHTLVYGGSRVGLMGAVAASTLAAGGKVIGVEPRFFIEQELQLDGLTELIVTEDMTDRKTKMIELGDAFIAFPGGKFFAAIQRGVALCGARESAAPAAGGKKEGQPAVFLPL